MLPTQNTIKTYYVYCYTFLDDLLSIKSPYDYFADEEKYKIDDAIHLVGERFKEYGWEGDGSIGIIWLPPFVDVGIEDTWGTYIWHVKQQNNGVSFLACDVPLDFKRIKAQNEKPAFDIAEDMTPISIIEMDVNRFTKAVVDIEKEFKESISFLVRDSISDITSSLKRNLAEHYQNVLIRHFHEFLDDCYLKILLEVIGNRNSHNIKLRKTQIKVDPDDYYIPEDDEEEGKDIINEFISDMWKAYKWEKFTNKTDMLFKSIGYKVSTSDFFEIKKHVIVRNCMQHRKGCLDRDSLKQLGEKIERIEMKEENGTFFIDVWQLIHITEQEIYSLCGLLKKFVNEFHAYIKQRIPKIHYMHMPEGH